MKLILLGAPGAGKGTQAEILSKELGIPAISTGNILRAAIKDGTPVGLRAKAYIEAGQLAPDDIIMDIISERLAQPDCEKGYILDGVPRTVPQAEAMEKHGIEVDHVVSLEISDEDIVTRMGGRRSCRSCGRVYHVVNNPPKSEGVCDSCGGELYIRNDDTAETVNKRLEVFHRQTAPLKDFYDQRGLLYAVESQPTIDATTVVIRKALGIV